MMIDYMFSGKKRLLLEIDDAINVVKRGGIDGIEFFEFHVDRAVFKIEPSLFVLKNFRKRVVMLYPTTIRQLNKTFTDRQLFPRI